jgi:tRNA threonylcarbamoyladenosine biosynthesis protein TsaE
MSAVPARAPAAPIEVVASDVAATRTLGRRIGEAGGPGDVICLFGELGAGKTQLAKGIAAGLGVEDIVNSPSFVLMAEYDGRVPLFHLDLYRLADATEALAGGLVDDRQETGVTVIEWAERLGAALPAGRLDIAFDGTGDGPRLIELRPTDERHARLAAEATR